MGSLTILAEGRPGTQQVGWAAFCRVCALPPSDFKENVVQTHQYLQTLSVYSCCHCGITFAMTEENRRHFKNTGKSFYCIKGHSQFFGESDEKKIKQLENKIARKESIIDQLDTEVEHLSRSRNAIKGHLTKTKNRISNGVCPCCNRSFKDLQRHMESKHPNYSK